MKNIYDNYSVADFGCIGFISADKLPRRACEVGGSLPYKVGDKIELLRAATFPAIQAGGKPYDAVCALVNGTPSQVSFATLLGDTFVLGEDKKTKHVKVENNVNHLPIKEMLGKTLVVESLTEYKAKAYNPDASAPIVEISKKATIFEPLVGLTVTQAKVDQPIVNASKPPMTGKIGDLKSQFMSPLIDIFKTLITQHGNEILEQEQRLKAMLGDLLPHEKQMRYLLELSLRAELPKKLLAIRHETPPERNTRLNSLKHYFKEDYFLDEKAVNSIFECWEEVLLEIGNKKQIDSDTVTDIEGNVYKTVKIGKQVWMAENLKTTRYNEGTPIPNFTNSLGLNGKVTPAYFWYDNDIIHRVQNGALYNWHVIETGMLAPKGWHIPTDSEWTELEFFLIENGFNYDSSVSGNKISKSLASQNGWSIIENEGVIGNNLLMNNKSGFSALPCGTGDPHDNYSRFTQFGDAGFWWSATPQDHSDFAWYRYLGFNLNKLGRNLCYSFQEMSVRCIKDK